jgi:putative hydrolase of the HAD superfamily
MEVAATPGPWPFGTGVGRVPAVDRSGRWRRSRGLIIDLDNTLYPQGRFIQSGFAAVAAHVAKAFDVPADAAYLLLSRCAALGEQQTAFQSLCQTYKLGSETVPVLLEVFRSHHPVIFLGHGARDLLLGLRAEGWRLAVLTNGVPSIQARKVEALGLGEFVDHVLYAEHFVPGGKPAPQVFLEALRRLGTVPERTVCVGDDPGSDIAGARAAGLATLRLAVSDVRVAPELEADIVVETLAEIPRAAASLVEGVRRHAA